MFEWAYNGANASIPRNVGPECAYFLPNRRKILETIFSTVFIIFLCTWAWKRMSLPKLAVHFRPKRRGEKILLVLMSFILGMEIGFKFTSRTVVYIFNPCHVTSMLQLYLLAAEPSPLVTAIFRIQLNLMNGPFLAYAFPETESRRIFADKALYYIQHALMVVIPYYLLRIGGPYTAEPLSDMSWCAFSFGLNMAYHFLFLQFMALPIQVNLSHILCPAILDPFGTENYRLWTLVHQGILCPLLCKFICATSSFFLTKFPPAKTEPTLTSAIQESSCNWDDNHSKESSKTSDLVSSSSQNSHKHVE